MARRLLQAVLTIVGLIAVITGAWGYLGVADASYGSSVDLDASGAVLLDSNARYFTGLWLGAGLVMLAIVPAVDRRGHLLYPLSIMVFLGGVGRILSIADFGSPSMPFTGFAVAEVLFPLLIPLWWATRPPADRRRLAFGFRRPNGAGSENQRRSA